MKSFTSAMFDELASEFGFVMDNLCGVRTVAEAARFYEEVQRVLRSHAILRILIDGDPDGYRADLVQSGYARRSFLRRAHREGYIGRRIGGSYRAGLVDAIAAGAFKLAEEIARLSPDKPLASKEYSDDFWYAHVVGGLVQAAPPADLEERLVSFDESLEGEDSARLLVCRALVGQDAGAFERSFEDLLTERDAEVEAARGRAEEDVIAALDAMIFVEGVALIRLAQRRGMSVSSSRRGCPALALAPGGELEPTDEFPS